MLRSIVTHHNLTTRDVLQATLRHSDACSDHAACSARPNQCLLLIDLMGTAAQMSRIVRNIEVLEVVKQSLLASMEQMRSTIGVTAGTIAQDALYRRAQSVQQVQRALLAELAATLAPAAQ